MKKTESKKKETAPAVQIKNFNKPIVFNFPGTKSPVDFKPNARFQSINRSRR